MSSIGDPLIQTPKKKIGKIIAAAAAVFFIVVMIAIVLTNRFIFAEAERHNDCRQNAGPFIVNTGDSLRLIGEKLELRELIADKYIFIVYAIIKGKQTALQAGNYVFTGECSVAGILDAMASGRVMTSDIAITFPEGLRIEEVQQLFSDKGIIIHGASYSIGEFVSPLGIIALAPASASIEGYLFPETYRFDPTKEDERAMLQKMVTQFEKELSGDIIAEIQNTGKALHDIIIIASLIEKEVRSDKDKALVSGIIYKRLSLSMPLQIDATVAYIVKKKTTKLSSEDISINSPYNTYKYKDLPLGPIASPGLSSIRAALHPEASEYLYYLSKPNGETVFSRSYDEHVRAKNMYLR